VADAAYTGDMTTRVRHLDDHVLRQLAHDPPAAPCVSVYLPPQRGSFGRRATEEHVAQLRRRAAGELAAEPWSYAANDIAELVDPALARLLAVDREPHEGFALFITPTGTDLVLVPGTTPESVTVAGEPDLLPLVSALSSQTEFDLLVLSQHLVQLFRSSAHDLQPMMRYDLPKNRDDALWFERHEPNPARLHPGPSAKDLAKVSIERFIEIVVHRLPPAVQDGHHPLVVVAVEYEAAMFRKLSSHPRLITLTELGSPDHVALSRIHDAAVKAVLSLGDEELAERRAHFAELDGTGLTAVEQAELQAAAAEGRIDTLFVGDHTVLPACMLVGIVTGTLRAGGTVVAHSPNDDPRCAVAATLRY
jgi:Bacterial archaeo-eukaryotic release factor family 3